MKKLNSTKGNETTSKSKLKFFKAFGFSSLALLMGIAGTMAFAPLGASPSVAGANEMVESTTSGLGLDPKKDPIVYTTESGLEIRMSNATKYSGTTTIKTNKNYSYTQDLTSFYYFTMGSLSETIYTGTSTTSTVVTSNAPVNWIILGLGKNTGYFLDQVTQNLFSTWKTNSNGLSHENSNDIGGSYFFEEIYETISPAGNAIYSELATKAYIMDKVAASIPVNDEIPDGCMLVLSEKLLGSMYFNSAGAINQNCYTGKAEYNYVQNANYCYGNRYRYKGNNNTTTDSQSWTTTNNAGGSLYNYINTLFSKNNSTSAIISNKLGFTQAQADLIVPQQLYTYYYSGSSHLQETPSSDGGTYYSMFPLAYKVARSAISQNFCIDDYLTTNAQRAASIITTTQACSYWLRSGGQYSWTVSIVQPDGSFATDSWALNTWYARPAMVMKLQ